MNSDLAREILVKLCGTEDVKINTFVDLTRSVLGENWAGQIVEFEVEASIRGNPVAQVSKWVGKFSNPLTTNGSFLKSAQVERNEILFYSEFVPALLTFLRGRTEVHLCPVYYATYKEDGVGESFMIMDNLKARGYAIPLMVKTGMDFLHCKILLEELARVHGASHAFISSVQDSGDGPLDAVAFLKKDFLHRDADKVVMSFFQGFGPGQISCARQALELLQTDHDPLLAGYDTLLGGRSQHDLEKEALDPTKSRFNVLAHHDLWICNLLYRNDEESHAPHSVVILDWSVCHWNNPAVDLVNFFSTSADRDVLDNHFEALMNIYFSSLSETLEKLGVDSGYSFEDLMVDYNRRILWGSLKGFTWIPINLANPEQLAEAGLSSGFSDGATMISNIKKTAKTILGDGNGTGKERLTALAKHTLRRAMLI